MLGLTSGTLSARPGPHAENVHLTSEEGRANQHGLGFTCKRMDGNNTYPKIITVCNYKQCVHEEMMREPLARCALPIAQCSFSLD